MSNGETTAKQPGNKKSETPAKQTASKSMIIGFGWFFIILSILLVYLLIQLWPASTTSQSNQMETTSLFWGLIQFSLAVEARVIFIIAIVGALGGIISGAISFSTFVGNRELTNSWSWWYILKPFIGMSLAIIVYLVFRGGLFSAGGELKDINLFGFAAIAGLVGLFSKQAMDKLKIIFDEIFKNKEDAKRGDKLAGDDDKKEKPQEHS